MTDVIMVSYGTQALALAHHTYDLALLVGSQLWLGPKFDASFSGSGAPTIGTSKDAGSFVLRKGRQESQNSLPERRGQIQPLPIKSLEGGTTSCNPLNDTNTVQHG